MFGRRHAKTRRELVRAEFGESLELFRQAAAHAAGGLGASVGPQVGTAKDKVKSASAKIGPGVAKVGNSAAHGWDATIAAFVPLAEAARTGSAKAAKLSPHSDKSPKTKRKVIAVETTEHHVSTGLVSLLAAGAALGATGALVARRRNRAKWAEYEPSSVKSDATSLIDSTKSGMPAGEFDDHPNAAEKFASWCKDHTKAAVETVRHKIHEATADHNDAAGTAKAQANDAKDRMGDAMHRTTEGAGHLAGKAEARLNDASDRRGGVAAKASDTVSSTGNRVGDEVDDLLRSSKNGRM